MGEKERASISITVNNVFELGGESRIKQPSVGGRIPIGQGEIQEVNPYLQW